MLNYTEIGKNIKNTRLNQRITLREMGRLVGLSAPTIKRYEDGLIKAVDLTILNKFAEALNVPPAELLGLEKAKKIYEASSDEEISQKIEALAIFLGISPEELQQKIKNETLVDIEENNLLLIDDKKIREAPKEIQEQIVQEVNNYITFLVNKYKK